MKSTRLPILLTLAGVAICVAIIYRHKQELPILESNLESQSPNRWTPRTSAAVESTPFIRPVEEKLKFLGGRRYQRPDGEIFTSPPDDGPPISIAPKPRR